ncbi:hypothetical protein [Mesorhizobium sp. SP-1A]|uniref:hypothetical protein n=1 Tax=Mesorhizobium sp. SP-1A TaxID=3077840 RepID=UPI0028F73544|nr:hypothetical protein [Mesorhizobium sp. SP-1A]
MSHHEFPLEYRIVGIFPRHRNEAAKSYLEFVELEVTDVSPYEAPEGAILTSEHATERLRYFDGRWFIADRSSNPDDENSGYIRTQGNLGVIEGYGYNSPPTFIDMAKSSVFDSQNFSKYDIKNINNRQIETPQPDDFRIIHNNSREEQLSKLANKVAANVIAVDGVLYTEVPEPVFVFDFSKEMYNFSSKKDDPVVNLRVVFGEPEFDDKEKVLVYSIDQREEVDRVIAHLATIEQIDVNVISNADYIFGHVNEVRREKTELKSEAKHWIRHDTDKMRDWDRSHIDAYLDFRDAWRAAEVHEFSDEALNKVAETLRDYGQYTNIGPYSRMVIERWEAKPIELDFLFDATPENIPSM